jgi:hypothetical protein
MAKKTYRYRLRYSVEGGKFVPPADRTPIIEGRLSRSPDKYGYTDTLFVASIVNGSVLLVAQEEGIDGVSAPSPGILRMVRDQINHYLETHLENES